MSSPSPQLIPYEVNGTAGPCTIEAQGVMLLDAQGYCQDSIIYLSIQEDWQPAQGTMICDGVSTPFTLPGHSSTELGPYGTGEEFLLVNDPQGFTVMRKFLEGDGYHSWTLIPDVGVLPLVPSE